ncbi:ATP-binding protein [Conexibacter stalactiti]|uniref:ATP-binding protein n=1 Tax=Conexibacter stalactiti TaxID=1940611 RepID=A0ABU4HJI7_9ACTN|nr:ATP-binding protein [Conexibacter stalactiti]MDW5593476.1 ATP-binding protein [Conexibacter stalactiti]MEC5034117.1 ATP-binding protein [Conexibacter stalactiti]
MQQLFGVPFRQLDLTRLRRFLEEAEKEPLLWEAKGGGRPDAQEIRRQCGGFANSNEGGYLLLGVRENGHGWEIDGMSFRDNEVDRYITTCLQEGVAPIPEYDVLPIRVAENRYVAVVQVKPMHAGPCIVRGTVFERVPGATLRVQDPTRLAALFTRGRRAHDNAILTADEALRQAFVALPRKPSRSQELGDVDALNSQFLRASVAVSSVTPGDDISAILFRASTAEHMRRRLRRLAGDENNRMPSLVDYEGGVAQDRRFASVHPWRHHQADWALTSWWTGVVTVAYRGAWDGSLRPEILVRDVLRPAFEAATDLVHHLGGSGPGYLRIALTSDGDAWPDGAQLARGPFELQPDSLDESLEREIHRTLGHDVPEPEPAVFHDGG